MNSRMAAQPKSRMAAHREQPATGNLATTVGQARTSVPSLRMRLLVTIGVSLTVLWSAVASWMYLDVRQELQTALDDKLAAAALMVAGLVSRLPPLSGPAAGSADAALEVAAEDGLACEVSSLSGGAIAQTLGRTVGSPRLAGAPIGYSTATFGGERWRTYVLQDGDVRVATADRMALRADLLRDIALTAAIPFAAALVGSLVILWLAIGRGLQPIEDVRNLLAARRPEDELPLRDGGVAAPPEFAAYWSIRWSSCSRVSGPPLSGSGVSQTMPRTSFARRSPR